MKQGGGGGGGGGGSEIDYFVMQTGNVYRQISCVAKQLLPFGLLECDSGSLFNCDLHLKYRNYIHIPVSTCVSPRQYVEPHASIYPKIFI